MIAGRHNDRPGLELVAEDFHTGLFCDFISDELYSCLRISTQLNGLRQPQPLLLGREGKDSSLELK